MKNLSICVNSNLINISSIINSTEEKNREVKKDNKKILDKIKENLENVTDILERNSREESFCFNKREILLQVWVLKKVIEEIPIDGNLNQRIDLLYENLDKEVFTI
jgi:hypothetical protein